MFDIHFLTHFTTVRTGKVIIQIIQHIFGLLPKMGSLSRWITIMNQPLLVTDKEGVRRCNREIVHRLTALDNHHRLHHAGRAIRLAANRFGGGGLLLGFYLSLHTFGGTSPFHCR